jgi:hypothetical protein
MAQLTHERLLKLLNYDQQTGLFSWLIAPNNRIKIGGIAGNTDSDGYVWIRVDGVKYAAARLAIFFVKGTWPPADADHEDGYPSNNRWVNIRAATVSQNQQNKRIQKNNVSGLKGIYRHKSKGLPTGQFRAQIKVGGARLHLGLFDCPAAAHFAYLISADQNFGPFARAA